MGSLRQPLPVKYFLEVYEGRDNCLVSFEGTGPFMAISRGDIIDTAAQEISGDLAKGQQMQVTDVVHLVWEAPGKSHIGHKVMVYVQAGR